MPRILLPALTALLWLSPVRAAPGDTGWIVLHSASRTQLVAFNPATGEVKLTGVSGRQPALSPNRATLVAVDERDQLVVIDLAAGSVRNFGANRNTYASPTFVGDDAVAYLREDRRGVQVCWTPLARFEEHVWPGQLPEQPGANGTLAWLPPSGIAEPEFVLGSLARGARGLYHRTRQAPRAIYQVTLDGDLARYPSVSPDGTQVLFTRDLADGIWQVPVAGGAPQRLWERGQWPCWSPDGKRVACLSFVTADRGSPGQPGTNLMLFALWTLSADGTGATVAVDGAGKVLATRGDRVAWR